MQILARHLPGQDLEMIWTQPSAKGGNQRTKLSYEHLRRPAYSENWCIQLSQTRVRASGAWRRSTSACSGPLFWPVSGRSCLMRWRPSLHWRAKLYNHRKQYWSKGSKSLTSLASANEGLVWQLLRANFKIDRGSPACLPSSRSRQTMATWKALSLQTNLWTSAIQGRPKGAHFQQGHWGHAVCCYMAHLNSQFDHDRVGVGSDNALGKVGEEAWIAESQLELFDHAFKGVGVQGQEDFSICACHACAQTFPPLLHFILRQLHLQ